MAFSYSSNSIEDLKNQINIVDVIGRVVPLKRAGSNYKGVCPFHNEKTPSFVVSDQKQIFTCFGCGAKGDAIEFVKRYYNLEFSEAVDKIATESGITLEKRQFGEDRKKYYDINRDAARFFYRNFTEKKNKGYSYMKARGIEDKTLKQFGIGYADEEWDSLYKHLIGLGHNEEDLVELGLISAKDGKHYDKFRNRVMFPILNTGGKVIGFGGRAIGDDNPKYLNSSESKVFQKKNNLYGLNLTKQYAAKEGYIILVEGYMDVVGLFQGGVTNVSASLGTALTDNQAKLIRRYTDEVVLSYDADNAGRAAALRGLDILNGAGCKVKVLHVNDGKDPDEFIKKNGRLSFLNLVDEALPLADYKLESAKKGFDLSLNDDKVYYMKKAVKILNELTPVEADIYVKKVAKDIGVSENSIRRELQGTNLNEKKVSVIAKTIGDNNRDELNSLEKNLLKIILTDEDFVEKVAENIGILSSSFALKIFTLAQDQLVKSNCVDIKAIKDQLEPDESLELDHIYEEIQLGGREKEVYEETIATWKFQQLERQEREILDLLSIAESENNSKAINELTLKFQELQEKKKSINRGNK